MVWKHFNPIHNGPSQLKTSIAASFQTKITYLCINILMLPHDVGFHVVWKHSNPHHSCPSPIENFPRHHLLIQEHLSMYKYSDIAMHMMLVFMFNSSLPCINYVVMIPCRAQINQILVPLKAAGVVANVAMWIIPFELSATARIVEMRGQILAIR